MDNQNHKALVATADSGWLERCTRAFIGEGWNVHVASAGQEALDLLRKHLFDFVVVDESFSDMGLVEFSLNVRDIASNRPVTLVGGNNLSRLQRVWRRCDVYFAGPKDQVLDIIRQTVPLNVSTETGTSSSASDNVCQNEETAPPSNSTP